MNGLKPNFGLFSPFRGYSSDPNSYISLPRYNVMNKGVPKGKSIYLVWAEMARNSRYWLVLVVVFGLFYLTNVLITNARLAWYLFQKEGIGAGLQLLVTATQTFHRTILSSSLVTLLFIGFLTSILVCLMVYNYQKKVQGMKNVGFFGGMGLFLGFLAPGCVPCGIGLIGTLGLASAFASLPLQGKEVSLLAIVFLIIAIIKVSQKVVAPLACAPRHLAHISERRSLH